MQENHRSGRQCRLANLSQSRELHWTDILLRQRAITGSRASEWTRRSSLSQS